MASTIKLKNSTTAGNSPSSLETGEVAINVADGNLFYGSASAVLQNFVVNELEVKGNLTAQQYIVSSSVTYTTQSFSSGSTAFGDSADDTHVFTGNITASGDIITTAGSLITTKTGSVTDPALHIKTPAGALSGFNAGIILEDLIPGTNFFVPYFVSNGSKIFGFGTVMTMETSLDLKSNKLYFDSDLANTYIASNADDPEDLELHADQDILLSPDRNLLVSGSTFIGAFIDSHITASGNISSSGTITANSLVGSHTLTTAAQPNVTSLGTLTALTVDQININSNAISSTSDSDVYVTIGTTGVSFDANNGDSFEFNATQNNVDLKFHGENALNVLYIDASTDNVGIGDATPTAKLDVAGNINTTSHITASGNISASGNVYATEFHGDGSNLTNLPSQTDENFTTADHSKLDGIEASADVTDTANVQSALNNQSLDIGSGTLTTSGVVSSGDIKLSTNNTQITQVLSGGATRDLIGFDADDNAVVGNPTANKVKLVGDVTASANISASGDLTTNEIKPTKIELEITSTTHGDANGDIVYFGGESGTIAEGQIVYYNSSGQWALADADAEATAKGLLGVALGGDASADGILLKGMVTLDHDPGTVGDPLFLSAGTAGQATSTAPNSTNHIVRLIGYCVDSTNGQIYFNPSNDFIKHS